MLRAQKKREEKNSTQRAQRRGAEFTEKRRTALRGSEECEADGAGDALRDRDLREGARCGVDAESHDVLGVLVFGEEELAGGVEGEVAGFCAQGGVVSSRPELAGGSIDAEHADGVVATVGCEEPFATGMDGDFSGVVAALEIREKHPHSAKVPEYAMIRSVSKLSDGRIEFAKDVKMVSIG